jgi:hypothetical protein
MDSADPVEAIANWAWRHKALCVLIAVAGPSACTYIVAANHAATLPARVAMRTLQTDNVLHNYELFFDLNAQFGVRQNQVREQQSVLDAETDPDERRRLRMELSAMEQSCRDIAAQYNANSAKQNRALFKARNLPETLTCAD